MAQLNFSDIENIIHQMHCDLRNKEGITGISAMHHINLVLLMRSLTKEKCEKIGLDCQYSFEELKDLSSKDLFKKVYNREEPTNCWLFNIWKINELGFNKDIPFEIKNETTLHSLFCRAKTIDTKYMFSKTDIIGDIYESFINREGKTMKDLGQYFTDRDLIDYLVNLTQPKVVNGQIESIYDGASGTGGFLTQAIKYVNDNYDINWSTNAHNIYGIDINRNTFALLKLNMFYTVGEIMPNLSMNDSLRTESTKVDGFDVILMNPPFGVKGLKYTDMNDKIKELRINGTKGEILFLQNCMVNLADGGRCCIVVPDGVLFNSTKMYKETRKYLLENFELEKVIKVGDGEFFKNTGVKTAVLFFKKTGESTKSVEFVQVNKVGNTIEEVPLLDVSMEKIKENDYSLNMNLFKEVVLNTLDNIEVKNLKDICESRGGEQLNVRGKEHTGEYPVISGGLKPVSYINKYNREENTIIISGSGNAGYVSRYNTKIWASDCWSIHSLDKNILNEAFLYYYLKFQQELILSYGKGAIIKHINFNDISNIPIPLPPIDFQERIVEQLDNIYENEIKNSKKTIEGLEASIENIMKNTLYRTDMKVSNLKQKCILRKGTGVTKKNRTGGNIPYYCSNGHSGNSYMNKHNIEGKFILLAEDGNIGSIHFIRDGTKIWVGDHVHIINPKDSSILTDYLYWFLKYNIDYNTYTTGSVIPKLNKNNLEKIILIYPDIKIQEEIVEELNSKETIINLLKNNITQAEKQANDIMSQLFQ